MKLINKILKNINDPNEFDPPYEGSSIYIFKDPINEIISEHGVNKILEHIDIEDIQNFLRAKKLQKITKKK